jgi:hypothetical protein
MDVSFQESEIRSGTAANEAFADTARVARECLLP